MGLASKDGADMRMRIYMPQSFLRMTPLVLSKRPTIAVLQVIQQSGLISSANSPSFPSTRG